MKSQIKQMTPTKVGWKLMIPTKSGVKLAPVVAWGVIKFTNHPMDAELFGLREHYEEKHMMVFWDSGVTDTQTLANSGIPTLVLDPGVEPTEDDKLALLNKFKVLSAIKEFRFAEADRLVRKGVSLVEICRKTNESYETVYSVWRIYANQQAAIGEVNF
jgi:hypothetical protein